MGSITWPNLKTPPFVPFARCADYAGLKLSLERDCVAESLFMVKCKMKCNLDYRPAFSPMNGDGEKGQVTCTRIGRVVQLWNTRTKATTELIGEMSTTAAT